jgi:RNA polymerase sigma factor (sigma-70 family)
LLYSGSFAAKNIQQSPQENLVDQDIAVLKRMAEDAGRDPQQRRKAKQAAETLEFLKAQSDFHSEAAKAIGLDSRCRMLSDEDLAQLIADASKGHQSTLYNSLATSAASCSSCDLASELSVVAFARWLYDLVCVALVDELALRQDQRENFDGQRVRAILVDEAHRGEQIQELADRYARYLWIPGDQVAGREDAASEIVTRILPQINDLASASPVATSPGALLAFMTGKLNRVLGRALDGLRTQIETEDRRAKKQSSLQVDADDVCLVPLFEQRSTEINPFPDLEQKLLIEQLLSRVSEKEAELIKMQYFEGKTQEDIALTNGMSQGQVSKILSEAIETLRQASKNQSDSPISPES